MEYSIDSHKYETSLRHSSSKPKGLFNINLNNYTTHSKQLKRPQTFKPLKSNRSTTDFQVAVVKPSNNQKKIASLTHEGTENIAK